MPRVCPRALAAARAAFLRWEIARALLLGEGDVQVQQERLDVGAEIGDQKRRLVRHEAADEVHVAREPVEVSDGDGARLTSFRGAAPYPDDRHRLARPRGPRHR